MPLTEVREFLADKNGEVKTAFMASMEGQRRIVGYFDYVNLALDLMLEEGKKEKNVEFVQERTLVPVGSNQDPSEPVLSPPE